MYFIPSGVVGKPESISTATIPSGAPVKTFVVFLGAWLEDHDFMQRFHIGGTKEECQWSCLANSISA